jgi:hypothetical protein
VVGFILILIPIATMTRDILSWANHQYIITNRRVVHISGIFDKADTDSTHEKVNDDKLTQSMFGRMFDYGNIEILTASELGVDQFKRIERPVQFKTAMQNAKQRLESGENFTGGDIAVAGGMSALPALLSQLADLRQRHLTEEFSRKASSGSPLKPEKPDE